LFEFHQLYFLINKHIFLFPKYLGLLYGNNENGGNPFFRLTAAVNPQHSFEGPEDYGKRKGIGAGKEWGMIYPLIMNCQNKNNKG